MIHDVFDMAARVMELEEAFFLVALDTPTLRAACGAGYAAAPAPGLDALPATERASPAAAARALAAAERAARGASIAERAQKGNLKTAVQNTKFVRRARLFRAARLGYIHARARAHTHALGIGPPL